VYVREVGFRYFRAHGYFGGGLDGGFQFFWEDDSKVGRGGVCPEACVLSVRRSGKNDANDGLKIHTHEFHHLGIRQVVRNDFCHLREMPAVPFLQPKYDIIIDKDFGLQKIPDFG
jgi:hypothetical protein